MKRQADLVSQKNLNIKSGQLSFNTTEKSSSEDIEENDSDPDPYISTTTISTVKTRLLREKLSVSPKFINATQYKSFQVDCVYHGSQYKNVRLVWLKDGSSLNTNQDSRLFTLDYKQNNMSICILKFSYALLSDGGQYKCIAINSSKKHFLNDELTLVMQPSNLQFLIL